MSYDLSLLDPVTKATILLVSPHYMPGGTYCVGGSAMAELNITYNYAKHFYRLFGDKGIRSIYGMSGTESIPILKKAADSLSDDVDADYWQPTEGNVKRALLQLIALAEMRPDGIWVGD